MSKYGTMISVINSGSKRRRLALASSRARPFCRQLITKPIRMGGKHSAGVSQGGRAGRRGDVLIEDMCGSRWLTRAHPLPVGEGRAKRGVRGSDLCDERWFNRANLPRL